MGLSITGDTFQDEDFARFGARLDQNLEVLAELLARTDFGRGPTTLGAELEVSIVDESYRALPINTLALQGCEDPRVQPELCRFNLEYNLAPVTAVGTPFSAMARGLERALATLDQLVAPHGGRIASIGIVPTLAPEELGEDAMTDLPRYQALSQRVRDMRQRPFQICIEGDDLLSAHTEHLAMEGANTSFQVHLRVAPDEFAGMFNAAQLATPVALAAAVNSPTFLGHRLWDETRVALFKQATDTRSLEATDWRPPPRVPFGQGWVRRGAQEVFAETAALHPVLLPVVDDEDPRAVLAAGGVPSLRELRLHQGTVWQWNRPVYDPALGGHLRIELRALPSGPTPVDMAANAAFLVGLTVGLEARIAGAETDAAYPVLALMPFAHAERNFYRAARHGLDATILWPEGRRAAPREFRARDLCLHVLPIAEQGLVALGVDASEIAEMLGIIRERAHKGVSPAAWQRHVLADLENYHGRPAALIEMLKAYLDHAATGRPVATWTWPKRT